MKSFILSFILFYSCGNVDRSTMNSVRLKSDATTDSIEYVVKEMLLAISTNNLEKAKDFLSRKKKRKKEIEQQEKGGALVLRDKSSAAAAKFVGGKDIKDSGSVATLAPGGGKTSFGEINEQIDNIVGLTSSIDAIVQSQYKEKKDEIKELSIEEKNEKK